MTWTAPDVTRVEPPQRGDERACLDAFLDFHRQTLLWKCSGLSGDQLRLRAVGTTNVTLLGLLRHLAEVERWWFRRYFTADDVSAIYNTEDCPDADFDGIDTADAEAAYAAYLAEIEACRNVVIGRSLEERSANPRPDLDVDLRWIYVHMIEEYSRHNGHADLIREAIDGATGE